MKLKKKVAIFLAACMCFCLTACNSTNQMTLTEESSVADYVFQVPKDIKDGAISYREMAIAVASGDYTDYEKATGVELAYSNFYQIEANDSTSVSLYCPETSLDLSTLNDQNEKASFLKLMDELAFEISPATDTEDATFFGVDTSTEFYQNIEFGSWENVAEKDFDGQKYMAPLKTLFNEAVSMEMGEELEDKPQVSVQPVDVSGYITMITPTGKPTRIMMVYARNEIAKDIPMKEIALSLKYDPSNAGCNTVFDANEIGSIEEASMNAAMEAIKEVS